MNTQMTIFRKVTILVILLLIPIVLLYGYSNYVSEGVVKDEIKKRNLKRISFSTEQLDAKINRLSQFAFALDQDSTVDIYQHLQLFKDYYDAYDTLQIKKQVQEKISLSGALLDWPNNVTVYSPSIKESIGNGDKLSISNDLIKHPAIDWTFQNKTSKAGDESYFVRHIVKSLSMSNAVKPGGLIIELKFPASNIKNYLDTLKIGNDGDPFLYNVNGGAISSHSGNHALIDDLIRRLNQRNLGKSGSLVMKLSGDNYLVSYAQSTVLPWTVVDYVKLQSVLKPITTSRNLFYSSIGLLLLMSLLASFLLYRHVHVPIRDMVVGMLRIKNGDYSTRLSFKKNNEFAFLFENFNQMTENTEHLIEKVYAEKIHTREAQMKQFQSQINPHFLYNCLYYIKNMVRLGNEEAVEAMTLHLSDYYRYTTRVEKQMVTVREEIEFVEHFLEIHALRMKRIKYTIDIPEQMLDLEIPSLLIQPIAENAIVHGVERKEGDGIILIHGYQDQHQNRIVVDDNGFGVTKAAMEALRKKITEPMNEEIGCGMWNVNQRLHNLFDENAGLELSLAPSGGLRVVIYWPRHYQS